MSTVSTWVVYLQNNAWLSRILGTLLIALLGYWCVRILSRAIAKITERAGVDAILSNFIRNLILIIGLAVVFVAALDQAGVPTNSLLAIIGAAGLAVGLALKDSLSNIASGFLLIILRPFRAGDSVQVAGLEGVVEQVKVFQTHLHTYDNRRIVLPNSLITTAPIINLTDTRQRRIEINFRLSINENIEQARTLCVAVANKNSMIMQKPAPELYLIAISDSLLDVQLRAWTHPDHVLIARSQIIEMMLEEFQKMAIQIPAPKREMYMPTVANP